MTLDPRTIEACAKAIRRTPSLDENGYVCEKSVAIAAIRALASETQSSDGGLNGQARNPVRLPDSSGDLASAGGIAGIDITDHCRQVGIAPSETLVEIIAREIWHRFAPVDHIEWKDETHKSEFLMCAQAVLSLARKTSTADVSEDELARFIDEFVSGRDFKEVDDLARALLAKFIIGRRV